MCYSDRLYMGAYLGHVMMTLKNPKHLHSHLRPNY